MTEQSNVIQFPATSVEVINGRKVNLGRLALPELLQVEQDTRDRFEAARDELMVIEDVRARRFPGGGAS